MHFTETQSFSQAYGKNDWLMDKNCDVICAEIRCQWMQMLYDHHCVFSDGKAAKLTQFERKIKTAKKEEEMHYMEPPDGGWGWMVVLHCFLVCLQQHYLPQEFFFSATDLTTI